MMLSVLASKLLHGFKSVSSCKTSVFFLLNQALCMNKAQFGCVEKTFSKNFPFKIYLDLN